MGRKNGWIVREVGGAGEEIWNTGSVIISKIFFNT